MWGHYVVSWVDVLQAIAALISERVAAANLTVPVYVGARVGVPTLDQIHVIRGRCEPDELVFCPTGGRMRVYVELWVTPSESPNGETDLAYANSQTLLGYERLAALSAAIGKQALFTDQFNARWIETLPDSDAFRPTCAERMEFLVDY